MSEPQGDVIDMLRDYMVYARQAGKTPSPFIVTESEMSVLLAEADTDAKLAYLEKNFIVIQTMNAATEFREKMLGRYTPQEPPTNRAERRRSKFERRK